MAAREISLAELNFNAPSARDPFAVPVQHSNAQCRICLKASGELIAPCHCRNKWVHRHCLDRKRVSGTRSREAFTHCRACGSEYHLVLHRKGDDDDAAFRWRYRCAALRVSAVVILLLALLVLGCYGFYRGLEQKLSKTNTIITASVVIYVVLNLSGLVWFFCGRKFHAEEGLCSYFVKAASSCKDCSNGLDAQRGGESNDWNCDCGNEEDCVTAIVMMMVMVVSCVVWAIIEPIMMYVCAWLYALTVFGVGACAGQSVYLTFGLIEREQLRVMCQEYVVQSLQQEATTPSNWHASAQPPEMGQAADGPKDPATAPNCGQCQPWAQPPEMLEMGQGLAAARVVPDAGQSNAATDRTTQERLECDLSRILS